MRIGATFAVVVLALGFRDRARADAASDEAEHARLVPEFARTGSASVGCSLGELERRLGRLDESLVRLGAILTALPRGLESPDDPTDADRATVSACHYNRGRVREARGELLGAYRDYGSAAATPIPARRRVVESALVRVASIRAASSACASLESAIEIRGLLRYADDPVLRRCLRAKESARPTCRRLRGRELVDASARVYPPRPSPSGLLVGNDDGVIVVARTTGGRATSGFECSGLITSASSVRLVGELAFARGTLLVVESVESTSYAGDCDDCREIDATSSIHLLRLDGAHLLSFVDRSATPESIVTGPDWAVDGVTDEWSPLGAGPTVNGRSLELAGRTLALVSGALIPVRP